MFIAEGRNRMVLCFPKAGFVLKFPMIRIRAACVHLFRQIRLMTLLWKSKGFSAVQEEFQKFLEVERAVDVGIRASISWALFKGIVGNCREFWFSWRHRHPFVQPTLFSFLGLVNIQRYGPPVYKGRGIEIADQIWELMGRPQDSTLLTHHFLASSNYCSSNGNLSMCDYGDLRVQMVILRHGHQMREIKLRKTA